MVSYKIVTSLEIPWLDTRGEKNSMFIIILLGGCIGFKGWIAIVMVFSSDGF